MTAKRPLRFQSVSALLLAAFLVVFFAGCSSSGPQLSGFGLGDSRVVSVGEIVDLRLPLREDGSREWRVTSYDSRFLSIASRPEFITGTNGKPEMLIRARAKTPGETRVEVSEVGATSGPPQRRVFTVRINP